MIDFTEAELRSFSPKMAFFYKDVLLSEEGKSVLKSAGILGNGMRLAHFLGQVGAETAGGTIIRESLSYSSVRRIREVWPARARKATDAELKALVRDPVALGDWAYGGRMGNRKGKPGSPHPDGYDYRGGGWLQTTGRGAVQKYCDLCKIDIRPNILDDPVATLKFACAEWVDSGCNELADANDLMGISKTINTGSAESGIYPNGMEHRTAWFNKAKAIWWDADNIPVGPPQPAKPSVFAAAKVTAESRSIWSALSALLMLVVGVITDLAKAGWDWLVWLIGIAPTVYADAKQTLTPMQEMAGWFGKHIPKVTISIALVCITVFVVRHALLRIEAKG